MKNTTTAIVILNYNGKKYLESFLPTLIQYKDHAEVIIADNASTDTSVIWLKKNRPEVRLICLKKNYGFAEGYNKALAKINHQYVVLLNSDVEVTPNWLTPLLQTISTTKNCVAVQPKILMHSKKTHFEYAGAGGGMIDYLGYPFCRGRIFDYLEEDQQQYNDIKEVFWTSGACMLVDLTIYKELGGFDKRFFAHMEEIDLCWRMKNKGYSLKYCGESSVYHVGGGTLNYGSPRKTFLNYRNGLMMMMKNLPTNKLFPIIFSRLILDGISSLPFLLKGKFTHIFSILKAHFSFYSFLPALIKERKKSIRTNTYYSENVYKKSIVFEFFLRKKKKFDQLNKNS